MESSGLFYLARTSLGGKSYLNVQMAVVILLIKLIRSPAGIELKLGQFLFEPSLVASR